MLYAEAHCPYVALDTAWLAKAWLRHCLYLLLFEPFKWPEATQYFAQLAWCKPCAASSPSAPIRGPPVAAVYLKVSAGTKERG